MRNNADYTMSYTRGLGSYDKPNDDKHPDKCDVWNIDGGDRWKWSNTENCWQRALEKGEARGGSWTDFDVDAFTFNTHSYQVSFDDHHWRQVKQGAWTKISNVEAVTCYMAKGAIRCDIEDAAF